MYLPDTLSLIYTTGTVFCLACVLFVPISLVWLLFVVVIPVHQKQQRTAISSAHQEIQTARRVVRGSDNSQ
jgi:1,4-dihydroxy-2-naphthoate octaprenyltransferase